VARHALKWPSLSTRTPHSAACVGLGCEAPERTRARPNTALQLTWHGALQSGSGSILAPTLGASANIDGLCPAAERPVRYTAGIGDDMEDAEFLFTIAEVSVALAGFAALVTVVSQRLQAGSARAQVDRHFLLSLVLASLITGAFALFPYIPYKFGASPDFGWRLSSACFFLAWATYIVLSLRRIRSMAGENRDLRRYFPTRFALLNFTLQGVSLLGLSAGAIGLLGPLITPFYLAGLCVLLYVSGVLFVALLLSLLQGRSAL